MLQKTYFNLLTKYINNDILLQNLWIEIENNYSQHNRHYHTLEHLENVLKQLNEIKSLFVNWDATLFTLYYHDIVYDSLQTDNEEQSAIIAIKRMTQLSVPKETISLCNVQILATKTHTKASLNDINYFTDADLSILGESVKKYDQYSKNVRNEYSNYSNVVYNAGRKKVLSHFLSMDRIFKTDYFHNKLETKAIQNLKREIETL